LRVMNILLPHLRKEMENSTTISHVWGFKYFRSVKQPIAHRFSFGIAIDRSNVLGLVQVGDQHLIVEMVLLFGGGRTSPSFE